MLFDTVVTTLPIAGGIGVKANPVRVEYRPVINMAREGAQVDDPE